jgi:methionyl-tRNA formyltransferase
MRVIYFGSTNFSLSIIKSINKGFSVIGVVIVRPKPRGRGQKTIMPEMARWAETQSITVFAPEDPNDEIFIDGLKGLSPDIFVLSAYGHILGRRLLEIPVLGSINIHPSLLPRYRGAAPIQRAIMAGERETGVTVFFMDEKIDHGRIIFQEGLAIAPDEDFGSLHQRLSEFSAEIIIDVLKSIQGGCVKTYVQNDKEATYAPKIKKEEQYINWHHPAEQINNLVRALCPKPGARAIFRNKDVIILKSAVAANRLEPGRIDIIEKNLLVGGGNGSLILREIKPEGRGMMTGRDFVNGFRIREGEMMG